MRYEIVIAERDPQLGETERIVTKTRRVNGAYNEYEAYIADAYANFRKHAEQGDDKVVGGADDWRMPENVVDSYFIGHYDSDYNLLRYRRIFIREVRGSVQQAQKTNSANNL